MKKSEDSGEGIFDGNGGASIKSFSAKSILDADQFYRTGDGQIHLDVDVASMSVTLPVRNVGKKDSPVWVAYAHVLENKPLAEAARIGLYGRLQAHLRPIVQRLDPGEYVTLVTPPSEKTEELFRVLYEDLAAMFGKEQLEYTQLIGGYDQQDVESRAARGFVFPCDSVITQARQLHKFIGATPAQVEIIENASLVIGLDDIANTLETVEKMSAVAASAGFTDASPIQYFVIGTEAQWDPRGLRYPKQFPSNVHAFFQIPEIIGDLPPVRAIAQ